MTSAGPAMNPPQLASDLEKVPMRRSTRSSTPKSSAVPAPRAPSTPAPCASSTISRAPWRSARSQISGSGATSPSMEKTPSTTTRTPPPSAAARSSCLASLSRRLWREGGRFGPGGREAAGGEGWGGGAGGAGGPGAAEGAQLGPREQAAVEDRRVVGGVGDDGVAGREDRAERADVRLVAGGEDQGGLGAHPVGELALELEVQGDRPVEQPRAGQAGPV